jgi:tetratricopeptide (TPR) repeat protein
MKLVKMTSFACLLLMAFAGKADNATGINLYESGMCSASKVYFLKKVKADTSPEEKAEAYYYLGENYLMLDQRDSARLSFEQGLALLPTDPYNQIGLGGLFLKEDAKQAETVFKDVLSNRLYKRDVQVPLAVARAYLHEGQTDKAMEYIERAKKVDRGDGHPFLLEGDVLYALHRLGEAATRYDHAVHFTSELVGAYVKNARIYMRSNSDRAISLEKLLKVKEFAPEFCGVDCVIGELFEAQGDSKQAVEHYARFIEAGYYGEEHLLRYAGLLHFDKQYEKMLPIILPVLEKHPNNLVAKRLYAYALSKTEGGGKSIEAIKHFIETTPEENHIALDYACYAEQLLENERYEDAVVYYEKVIQKDTTKRALWSTIGDAFVKVERRDSADHYYALYESTLSTPDAPLLLKRGRNLYALGARDSVPERRAYVLRRADTMFMKIIDLAPTFVQAHLWRARIHSQLDPETLDGLAKPFYENVMEVVSKLENPDRYKNELAESCRYLGYYYYLQADEITRKHNDNPDFARTEYLKAKDFFLKALEYNPKDTIAAEALQGITIQ